ncbi:hypothetical protein EJV47_21250 [Hymenobacter gummosus]|uniref:Uncharacterized protein n=1 Tax=Hymenobacter gummosus TaxID=1776032 RepID=A0A3S0J709_9BACT|nr:hypothetical protein [Hymenobacter gummosus]RTQ46483.1 hypothetical protein EJV47_21250 [Hymenobacter gummosus]
MTLRKLLDIAKNQLNELTSVSNPDFRLEQAEFKKDEEVWDIVISYLIEEPVTPVNKSNPLNPLSEFAALIAEPKFQRMYKRIKIDKEEKVLGFYMFDK